MAAFCSALPAIDDAHAEKSVLRLRAVRKLNSQDGLSVSVLCGLHDWLVAAQSGHLKSSFATPTLRADAFSLHDNIDGRFKTSRTLNKFHRHRIGLCLGHTVE